MSALADRFSPLMFAAVGAWILCVCLHEFSHALVAYYGGDRSVKDKGYLSLDPLRFVHPVTSLLIPAIVLALGGLPLPGGAVLINVASLRSDRWRSAVSAAGPASNLLLFLILGGLLHPQLGLVNPYAEHQPTWVHFVGAMSVLNFIAALFNLIPLPPFDGYGMIEHRFDRETQWRMRHPQVAFGCLAVVFFLFATVEMVPRIFFYFLIKTTGELGMPIQLMIDGYRLVFFNEMP